MNPSAVARVAAALAVWLHRHPLDSKSSCPLCAIGYDGRSQSSELAALVARVLSGAGIRVLLSDRIIPTPVLSFQVKQAHCSAGIMITASHNPPEYNGIKFKAPYGGPFLTDDTRQVESFIPPPEGSRPIESEHTIETINMVDDYIQAINRHIDLDQISRLRFPVAIDSMAGAGQRILEQILLPLGLRVHTVDGIARTDFNGRLPEPIAANLAPLSDYLSAHPEFGIGMATDGDADRLGLLYPGGQWCSAQQTILMLTDYTITRRQIPGAIIKTSSVTDKIRTGFDHPLHPVLDVQVGFKYICEEMIRRPVAIGCEESGGYGFGFHLPERDGIISALLILEMLADSDAPSLHHYSRDITARYGAIHYNRIDQACHRPDRIHILPRLAAQPPDAIGSRHISHIDHYLSSRNVINGMKFRLDGDSRWLLIRASETEPMVRFYAEGQSDQETDEFLHWGIHCFGEEGKP
ncbi:MAG: phosphoglucomutase [Candidatus Delongbacteria bacterium]|nr:phosphoglucomutase [Candidatus Delongbacteria bacterium]